MMPVLANARHERFAQLVASGKNGAEAYVLAGYSRGGAKQSAARLLTHAYLQRRIKELQSVIADGIVKLAVTDRNARLTALQERQDALRSIVKARAADPNNQPAPGAKHRVHCPQCQTDRRRRHGTGRRRVCARHRTATGVARDREAGRDRVRGLFRA